MEQPRYKHYGWTTADNNKLSEIMSAAVRGDTMARYQMSADALGRTPKACEIQWRRLRAAEKEVANVT